MTYHAACASGLKALARAVGASAEAEAEAYVALSRELMSPWGEAGIPATAPYASHIGDDHSPFEYSLAFAPNSIEVRLLVESQSQVPGAAANRDAALELNERLSRYSHVDLKRFELVRDLFLPDGDHSPFALWHAVSLLPGQSPSFKIYLNPQAKGAEAAALTVAEAFRRLGLSATAFKSVSSAIFRHGVDQLTYFSLDLSASAAARVKVYVTHPRVTADEIEAIFRVCPSHRPGDALNFCKAMLKSSGPFTKKPLTSCLSFRAGSDEPSAATLHLPISHYVDTDRETVDRVGAYLLEHQLNRAAYQAAVMALAGRSLDGGIGVQSYASFRRENGAIRLTAYLSPELFGRAR